MIRGQQITAIEYLAGHLPQHPLPPAVRTALARERVLAPDSKSDDRPAGTGRQRRQPGAKRELRAEKLPSGRIRLVRERPQTAQVRRLQITCALLSVMLLACVVFFLTGRPPQLEPTGLYTLQPTQAADGARAVVISGPRSSQLVAAGLPALAPGFVYVAWASKDGRVISAGELEESAANVYQLRTSTGTGTIIRVTIERSNASDGTGPVVLEGLTLE